MKEARHFSACISLPEKVLEAVKTSRTLHCRPAVTDLDKRTEKHKK
jgi:hypothetical protein